MPYNPHPPLPSVPGVRMPLDSVGEARRETFVEDNETVCSLKLWERVNNRRKVCGLPPLKKSKRSAKDLAQGLLDMRDLWVKGEDWAQIQPGDDPLLVRYLDKVNYPVPRTVLARISYEGVARWRELRVPRLEFNYLGTYVNTHPNGSPDYPAWYPKLPSHTKAGSLTTRTSNTESIFTMSSGHGLVVDQTVDVMWRKPIGNFIRRQGCRISVKVTKVEDNAVTLSGGNGDRLPGASTPCYVMTDPTKVIKLHIWRRDPNPTCAGVARVCDRMKYTGTCRQLDRRQDPKDWEFHNSDGPNSSHTLFGGNTVNQWDQGPGGFFRSSGEYRNYWPPTPAWRETALRYKRFQSLNTGVGITAILRGSFEGVDEGEGRFFQYLPGGTNLVRALSVSGLTWPGIVYGTPNPDELDTGGSLIGYDHDTEYWTEVQNTTLSSSINETQTTLNVASASYIPYTGGYKMKIDNEIILVTDTNHPETGQHSIVVERGYNDTVPTTHSSGATVEFIDVTDFPNMFGATENWNSPAASNLPYPRSFLKDYISAGIVDFRAGPAGLGGSYSTTNNLVFEVPTQTFETSGTWVAPTGVTQAVVLAWGAGGGGGASGGGGGGAFVRSTVTVTPGNSYAITVGTGGIGSEEGVGTEGGESTFTTLVKAKGGAGGSSPDTGTVAQGGSKSDSVGTSRYAGGSGHPKGGGGSSAGRDLTGNNAFGAIGAESPTLGGDGGTNSEGESPGGGGSARKAGGNGKVIVMAVLPTVSLGGAFVSSCAIPDWIPYSLQNEVYHKIQYNEDLNLPVAHTASITSVGTYWVPVDFSGSTYRRWVINSPGDSPIVADTETNPSGAYYAMGTGTGDAGITIPVDNYSISYWTAMWSREVAEQNESVEDGQFYDTNSNFITNETIVLGQTYRNAHAAEIAQDWAIQEALTSGICSGPVLLSSLSMGWTNTLSEYDITAAEVVISESIAHDFKLRSASANVSGTGITEFEFNMPEFAEHGAEIYVWRRRNGRKTVRKYGPELYEHSVKEYNRWLSMQWFGGLSINSPSTVEEDVVITLHDIHETAITETETIAASNEILKWSDSVVAAGLPDLSQIGQGVPDNYVTNFSAMQIGNIFGVDIAFTDYYVPFIKYNFNDTNTGHEDNDGFPPGVTQNA